MEQAQIFPVPDLSDVELSPLVSTSASTQFYYIGNETGLPTITPKRLIELITNYQKEGYDDLIIIDARYDFEFRGGRIRGAINIRSIAQLVGIYERYLEQNVVIIFYCEYSQCRSPCLFRQFRNLDRSKHQHLELAYPHVYLLDGGYKKFFAEYHEYCRGGYTKMRDKEYVSNGELKQAHSAFKKHVETVNILSPMPSRARRGSVANPYFNMNSQTSIDIYMNDFTRSASQGV